MQTINIGKKEIEPIEWKKYEGEDVCVNTTIKQGKRFRDIQFYEDKVKAVPRGNAYVIGNGPSRKGFDLNKLKATGQTYGCNALYRDFMPDFIFSVDTKMSMQMVDDEVGLKTVHYGPALEVNRKLIGFDFREYGKGELNNIYQGTDCYGERHDDKIFEGWFKQFRDMLKMRPYVNYTVVHDDPPEFLNYLQTGTDLGNSRVMSYKEFEDTVLAGS
jgi:hypothetical protein